MGQAFERRPAFAGQAQPGLVDKRGSLESVVRGLVGHFARGQLAQFRVHGREQLLSGLRLASLHRIKDHCDVAHGMNVNEEHPMLNH